MASRELIVDDDYCSAMGNYFVNQGNRMDELINSYVLILTDLSSKAIISGNAANALRAYITYASKLKKQIGRVSKTAKNTVSSFLTSVDNADQYLF